MHAVAEIHDALAAGRIAAADFLRGRWRQLTQLIEQARDPAWISLATEAQLEDELVVLGQRDPAACPLYGRSFCGQRQYRCRWLDHHRSRTHPFSRDGSSRLLCRAIDQNEGDDLQFMIWSGYNVAKSCGSSPRAVLLVTAANFGRTQRI